MTPDKRERKRHRPTPNPYDLSEATHNYSGKRIKPKKRRLYD